MADPNEPSISSQQDSRTNAADFRKTLAGDAVLLFLVTCATYLTVYIFEAGYCHYFKVPLYLIRLEVSTALLFAATSWLVLWLLLNFAFVYVSIDDFFRRRKNPILRRVLLGNGPLIAASLFVWMFTGNFWFLFGVLLPACVFSLLLLRGDPEQTLKQFDEAAAKTKAYPFRSITRLRELGLIWIVQIGVWAFIWGSLWFGIGETFAKNQRDFLVIDAAKPKAVIRLYGDRLVCVQFDPTTKVCSPSFTIFGSSEKQQDFELQRIGPLLPATLR